LPNSIEPPNVAIEAAMSDLPSAMNDAPHAWGETKAGELLVKYSDLRAALVKIGHDRAAAEWAIHRHVVAGRLRQEPGFAAVPIAYDPKTRRTLGEGKEKVYDLERSFLRSTPALKQWWDAIAETDAGNGTKEARHPKRRGRPKLTSSTKPEDLAKRNVYELVRTVKNSNPTIGEKQLLQHFNGHMDFEKRVEEAGLKFNEALCSRPPGRSSLGRFLTALLAG
jgi:hypothetical protein